MICDSACSLVSKKSRCRLPLSEILAGTFRHQGLGVFSPSIFFGSSFGHFIDRMILHHPLIVTAFYCPYETHINHDRLPLNAMIPL
jgi:hypothetical protein